MTEQNFAQMRTAMVESQLRTSDVNDVRVVAAMAKVAREKFVPEGRRAMAYIDRPVRVDGGRAINPPLVTGRLITEANVKTGDKVLLIGAASGYGAAVLEALGAQVTAVEEDAALIALAKDAGLVLTEGSLAAGAPANAPYEIGRAHV